MRVLHLASCASGVGMLRHKFCGCDVAYLPVDLVYAPLFRDFSEKSLAQYIERCDNLLNTSENFPDQLDELIAFCTRDFSQYDEVVVWHGDTASEQLFFSLVCALVERPLSEVDLRGMYSAGWKLNSVTISACSPDNIEMLWGSVRRLPDSEKQQAVERWNRWSQSDADVRIMGESGEIVGVGADYFDDCLVEASRGEFCPAARVIGSVLCKMGFAVGDCFLLERVVRLVTIGRLQARASERFFVDGKCLATRYRTERLVRGVDLSEMRFFEIKAI